MLGLQMTVRDALNSAIDEEMARDQSVYILGEEVTDLCPPCSSTRCPGLLSCCMLWWCCRWGSTRAPTRSVQQPRLAAYGPFSGCLPQHAMLQITRGLLQKYGSERVRDTPITEVGSTAGCTTPSCTAGCVSTGSAVAALQQAAAAMQQHQHGWQLSSWQLRAGRQLRVA
jgi:pyruvate dehydrogenase E1 component beta subunit